MGEVILGLLRRTMPALINGGFNWVDVRDVCETAINAGERGVSGQKYLLSGNYATFPSMGKIIESVTGVRMPSFVSPLWLAGIGAPFASAWSRYTGKRPLYTSESLEILKTCNKNISHEKAARELGHEPRPFIETITDTCQWFLAAGYA
jgi:dihydroflavonol-4-reductase